MKSVYCNDSSLSNILVIVKNILNIIQISVPILLLVFATFQFIWLMKNPEEKNAIKKVVHKFLAAFIVFFLPMIFNLVMSLLGEKTSFSSCWVQANDSISTPTDGYYDTSSEDRKPIMYNSDDYESGISSASEFCPTKVSRTRSSYNNMTLVADQTFYINSDQKFEDGINDSTQHAINFTTQSAVYDCQNIIAGQHKSYIRNGTLHKNEGGRVAWYDITTGAYVTSVAIGHEGSHMARLAYDSDRDVVLVGVSGGEKMLQIDNKTKTIMTEQPYVTMSGGSNYFIKYDSYNHQLVGLSVGHPTSSISYYKYDESLNSYVKTGSITIKNHGKKWDPQNFNVDGQVIYFANSWPANGGNSGFAIVVYDMVTGQLLENHPLASNVTGGHIEDVIVDISGNLWLICPHKFWKANDYVAHAFSIGP